MDTETTHGYTFLIGDSNKKYKNTSSFDDILSFLIKDRYKNSINFFYNVKYDTNAIIKYLSEDSLKSLALHDETVYYWKNKKIYIKIIPDKLIKIQIDRTVYKFFDLAQFYDKQKLKVLACKVNMDKVEVEDIKNINIKKYVTEQKYYNLIVDRCIIDCIITQKLGEKMYNIMHKFIKIRNFYSCASMSRQLVLTKIQEDINLPSNKIMDMAMKSFNAGRFEVMQKGFFDQIIERDINSAYPFEISNLLDCSGIVIHNQEYDENTTHSFFECDIDIPNELHFSPFKFQTKKGMMTYPTGKFQNVYMCKKDFETLNEMGIIKKIHKASHIYNDNPTQPFKYVEDLYYYRKEIQEEEKELADTIKRTLNSIYGTFLNINHDKGYIEDENDNIDERTEQDFIVVDGKIYFTKNEYTAGSMFHSIWGSEITAGTRNKIFWDFEPYEDKIITIATDGVKLTDDVPFKEDNILGGYDKSKMEEGVIIGSGVYQIGNKTKFRGFDSKLDLVDILKKHSTEKEINTQVKRVLGLKTCYKTNKMQFIDDITGKEYETDITFNNINQFIELTRTLDINFDHKRNWDRKFKNCKDVLKNNIQSNPLRF